MSHPIDITTYAFFRALTALPFIEAVYLYGSRARGDANAASDIDLAIVCPNATDAQWAMVGDVIDNADTLLKIDYVRLDALHDGRLKANILQDGVKIYG